MKYIFSMTSLLVLLFLCGCSSEEEWEPEQAPSYQIIVLFSPGGLGDRGYNDLILKGLQKIRSSREDVKLLFHSPTSEQEAERIFSDWLKLKGEKIPALFVLASNDYVGMTERLLAGDSVAFPNKDVLLFEAAREESLPISTFNISLYGASYMAGATAALCPGYRALAVLGSSNDKTTAHAARGFTDGCADHNLDADVTALADDWHGYAMADEAYRNMFEWAMDYTFIYPIAGGSNSGIYRYLREYPGGLYAAGMDVDQSALSMQIVGSTVKHIDRLVEDYLLRWIETGELPEYEQYGLESGYVDWVLSPEYEYIFAADVEEIRNTAKEKERIYHEAND